MGMESGNAKVREPCAAGMLYPEDPGALGDSIDRYCGGAPEFGGAARAIVSPHASFSYTGALAGSAWKYARAGSYDRVIVIGPCHTQDEQALFLPESDFYRTPFGDIPVDRDFADDLCSCATLFAKNDIPHFVEHSIEMQLPFMARLLPGASLVPVLFGRQNSLLARTLSKALAACLSGDGTLVVVSTDLASHEDRAVARGFAERMADILRTSDAERLFSLLDAGIVPACGTACLATLADLFPVEAASPRLLGRGDTQCFPAEADTGDDFVHYAAIAYLAERGIRKG